MSYAIVAMTQIGEVIDTLDKMQRYEFNGHKIMSIPPLLRSLIDAKIIYDDGVNGSVSKEQEFGKLRTEAQHHLQECGTWMLFYRLIYGKNAQKHVLEKAKAERPELHDNFYSIVREMPPKYAIRVALQRVESYTHPFGQEIGGKLNLANDVNTTYKNAAIFQRRLKEEDKIWAAIELARNMTLVLRTRSKIK